MNVDVLKKLKDDMLEYMEFKLKGRTAQSLDEFNKIANKARKDQDIEMSDDDFNEICEYLKTEITIKDELPSQNDDNQEGSEEDNSGDIIARTDSSNLSWFPEFKSKNKLPLWNRYERYLKEDKGWADKNINNLDIATDNILNLLGNPNSKEPFDRRGLIMGDVQSGKTANYTAICNKAADAGYNVIIVLTGIQEDLRKQTQERLDKEFVGADIGDEPCGVSFYDSENLDLYERFMRFTSINNDFEPIKNINNTVKSMGDSILLLVTKKNKTVLEKIIKDFENFIKKYRKKYSTNPHLSLLLIDDEADSASIDTNAVNYNNNINQNEIDPTAINACIRDILNLFDKKTYLGITATPFANCFINPEANSEKHDADIFPKDFIYVLDAPENYIGTEKIFGNNSKYNMIVLKKDKVITESDVPKKKENLAIPQIGMIIKKSSPGDPSKPFKLFEQKRVKEYQANITTELKESVYYFVLVNAIRDYRGDKTEHRSMIINVTHLKALHDELKEKLKPLIDKIKSDVKEFSHEESHIAEEKSTHIKELHRIFNDYKSHWNNVDELTWDDLLYNYLFKAIKPIELKVINSQVSDDEKLSFDREIHPEGIRVIIIGGYSLSRGLTLEGLCVTFFERNSNAYDTLLQMGRWFGYRPRYADLCKIWMSEELKDWYKDITSDVSELKKDIKELQTSGKSPSEVALKIRTSSARLSVTSSNKMGVAKLCYATVVWSKELVNTSRFKIDEKMFNYNKNRICDFVASLNKYERAESTVPSRTEYYFWKDIPKKEIANFVYDFKTSFYKFPNKKISEFIESMDKELWDVYIPEGEADLQEMSWGNMRPMYRTVYVINDNQIEIAGGSRLGAGGIAKNGLTASQIKEIEDEYFKLHQNKKDRKDIPDKEYLIKERKPILFIYAIKVKEYKGIDNTSKKLPELFYAIGIGFPDVGSSEKVEVLVNAIIKRELEKPVTEVIY